MSTKTTFKRIALATVAVMGFGLLSVAPARADITGVTGVTNTSAASLAATFGALTNTGGTAAFTVDTALTTSAIGRGLYTAQDGYIGTVATLAADGLTGTFTAVTTTRDLATVAAFVGILPTTTVAQGVTAGIITGMTVTAGSTVGLNVRTAGTPANTEKIRANYVGVGVAGTSVAALAAATQINQFISFTAPATAGTYPMTIQHSVLGTFLTAFPNADRPFADVAFTLTVTAASGLSTALSTALLAGPGVTPATITTNAGSYSAVRTANTAIAQVEVLLKNSNGTAAAAGHVVSASISGQGFVDVDQSTTAAATSSLRADSIAASGAGLAVVHIGADGVAGTGTVTVSVTDAATLVTTVLGTFTVTSFGSVSKIEVSTTNYTIGLATGDTTGAANAARGNDADAAGALATTLTPAFIVKTTDSIGNVANIANALVPTIVSSNPVAVSGGTCVADNGAGVYSSGDGVGYYNCSFTTTALSKSGDKATLTISTLDPATGTTFLTTTLDVTVGGGRFTETLSLDKASYNPGEAMVVTRTAVDSAGNPVADGSAAPAVVFNKAVGGTAPGAGFYNGGTVVTSATQPAVFAPTSSGAFEARMSGRSGSTATVAIIATATVGDDGATDAANAASDAASEAIDAANAATDAANLAAEAADAATVAAEEARDAADAATAAVEALATEFATLTAGIKAQITTLANTVAKIAKKVKAKK